VLQRKRLIEAPDSFSARASKRWGAERTSLLRPRGSTQSMVNKGDEVATTAV
jgi:hypothetical protein